MTKEEQLLEYIASCGATTISDIWERGLEPAANRLLKKGKINRGTSAYSMNWTCPGEASKALRACKTKKAREALQTKLLQEIALGHDRSKSIAKVLLGTYDGKPNSVGYYP